MIINYIIGYLTILSLVLFFIGLGFKKLGYTTLSKLIYKGVAFLLIAEGIRGLIFASIKILPSIEYIEDILFPLINVVSKMTFISMGYYLWKILIDEKEENYKGFQNSLMIGVFSIIMLLPSLVSR